MTEQVWVIPEEDFLSYQETDKKRIFSLIKNAFFLDRPTAEESPEYKQIIPYIVIKRKGKYLTYKRTKHGGEKRLHEKRSIGIGGHINPIDKEYAALNFDILKRGIERELNEELRFPSELYFTRNNSLSSCYLIETCQFKKKIIYDNSNEVGKVHLGIPVFLSLSSFSEVFLKEKELSNLQWLTKKELLELDNLENWSKILLERTSEGKN